MQRGERVLVLCDLSFVPKSRDNGGIYLFAGRSEVHLTSTMNLATPQSLHARQAAAETWMVPSLPAWPRELARKRTDEYELKTSS